MEKSAGFRLHGSVSKPREEILQRKGVHRMEAGVSRHHGAQLRATLKSPEYHSNMLPRGLGANYVEERHPLRQPNNKIPVCRVGYDFLFKS